MKAIILAGGYGSRMGELCLQTPKPLIEICGKPVLLHQIEALKKEGITEFIFVTGYLSESIEAYFGNGDDFGVKISYYREDEPLGTAGALFRLNLQDDFLLCNGDLIFDIDISAMLEFHKSKKALATLLVHPNTHPYDSLVIDTDISSKAVALYSKQKRPESYPNLCNAGMQIVSPELLKMYTFKGKADFDKDVITPAVDTGRIFAYRSSEYIRDMGTPERLAQVTDDITSGLVRGRNKRNCQKAVFLDRDGTINKYKGYIKHPDEIELIDGVTDAVRLLHELGYLTIVITNQPVIARGDCSTEQLKKIHNRMEMLLSDDKVFLDGIYYCPHHPDKGFDGEVEELKIECDCRKPAPGLILQAQKDFNIDLSRSFMVGDSMTDAEAGKNAGCTPVLISNNQVGDILTVASLYDFAVMLYNK